MAANPISTWNAKRRFEEFTGHKATRQYSSKLDDKDVSGYRMGSLVGVAYEAKRDGKTDQYFHRFAKKARPELVARSDGKKLYIDGGDYHITDRGIEDMPTMFVVNPARRVKKRKSSTRRKRTAGGLFAKNPSSRKAKPMAVRRRRRKTARRSFARNPIVAVTRRRRRRSSYRRNPIVARRAIRRRRGFRRNPISISGKGGIRIMPMILPGIMIGAGAVGAELLMGYLPLPAMLKTGPQRYLTKGVISVLGGWALAKFINKKAGEAFALGGIAIAAHDAIKSSLTGFMPNAQFGQYMGGYNWDKYGYNTPSMNSYPNQPGIGYYQAAPSGAMGGQSFDDANIGQYT